MKHIIDLTKNNFDRIDFTEAKIIDFYCKKDLPTEFEFSVWGATILLDPHWKHDKSFIPEHNFKDLYVSGIGIECVIMWPYGFCNLNFHSNGNVDFKFNTEDLIFTDDYLKDPYRYTFKEK